MMMMGKMKKVMKSALVRGIPQTFVNAISKSSPPIPICIETAISQHIEYINALKSLGLNIIELAADERYPDCIFVEDNCVIIDDTVLIAHSGAESRRGETRIVEEKLRQLGYTDINYTENVDGAIMDGGDVLVTPQHIFVGLSKRTNEGGVEALLRTFQAKVTSVRAIHVESLHLKCVCTWAGENRMLITSDDEGAAVREAIKSITKFEEQKNNGFYYEFIEVPHEPEANVVNVNGTLLVPAERKHTQKLLSSRNIPFITVPNGEISKADGSTTCCSVLLAR